MKKIFTLALAALATFGVFAAKNQTLNQRNLTANLRADLNITNVDAPRHNTNATAISREALPEDAYALAEASDFWTVSIYLGSQSGGSMFFTPSRIEATSETELLISAPIWDSDDAPLKATYNAEEGTITLDAVNVLAENVDLTQSGLSGVYNIALASFDMTSDEFPVADKGLTLTVDPEGLQFIYMLEDEDDDATFLAIFNTDGTDTGYSFGYIVAMELDPVNATCDYIEVYGQTQEDMNYGFNGCVVSGGDGKLIVQNFLQQNFFFADNATITFDVDLDNLTVQARNAVAGTFNTSSGTLELSFASADPETGDFDYEGADLLLNGEIEYDDTYGSIITFPCVVLIDGSDKIYLPLYYEVELVLYDDIENIIGEAGIQNVSVSNNNAAVEYFDIQGRRINNPENGLFIRRQGNEVTKIVVR